MKAESDLKNHRWYHNFFSRKLGTFYCMPSEVIVRQGDEFLLAVKPQSGVDYTWTDSAGKTLSQKDEVEIVAGQSTVVRLTAKNGCGELTIATKITVVQ